MKLELYSPFLSTLLNVYFCMISIHSKNKGEDEPLKNGKDFVDIEDEKSRSSTPLSRQPSVYSMKSRQATDLDSRPSSAATSNADSQRPLSAKP